MSQPFPIEVRVGAGKLGGDSPANPIANPIANPVASSIETGNIDLLLYEVRHALAEWLDSGTEHTIDLRGIPLGPGEEDRLIAQLGRGEVQAQVTGLGRSELIETRFHGVWLVTHFDEDDQVIGRQIEVAGCPWLLKSQPADAEQALRELEQNLPPAPAAAGSATRLENRA